MGPKSILHFHFFFHALLAHKAYSSFFVCVNLRIHISHTDQNIVSWDMVDLIFQYFMKSFFYLLSFEA